MNIVLATDDNFVQHCVATMTSILENNSSVNFYIFSSGVTKSNLTNIETLCNKYSAYVNFIEVPESLISELPMPNKEFLSHISIATYYRLFISDLLPTNIEKVIYLDCDIIVRNSLYNLWEIDITNYSIAAVYHDDFFDNNTYERLGYNESYGYFNAGVLVINLTFWRKNKIKLQFLNFLKVNYSKIIFHDQDVLNAVLHNSVLTLSCKWNMISVYFTNHLYTLKTNKGISYRNEIFNGVGENPVIVHFVSRPKPWEWNCTHPFKNDYYYYLHMNYPWSSWKPKFLFNSMLNKKGITDLIIYIIIKFNIKFLLYNLHYIDFSQASNKKQR